MAGQYKTMESSSLTLPAASSRWFPGTRFPLPDYEGGSILNLMASITRALGGTSAYPNLRGLPPEDLSGHTNLVLLVIDGLGAQWLAEQSPQGILNRHRLGVITSVFPSTTASAITTFLTGDPPVRHGVTGWFTYLRELGCVMSILLGRPRYGGVSYRQAGVDLAPLLGTRPLFDRLPLPSYVLSPVHINHSDFNLALRGTAQGVPFVDLRDMFRQATRLLRQDRVPKYLYLYWPGLDSLGHETGMMAPKAATARHLASIEQALADFLVAAAGTRTLLLVTADHGQIDTRPEDQILLGDHPALEDCLSLPLCGEPRAAFCYVRPHRLRDFKRYCRDILADQALLVPSQRLVSLGLLGPGESHPRLSERLGDYTLLMRGAHVLRDRLASEQAFVQIGVHGGLSQRELEVPLCRLTF